MSRAAMVGLVIVAAGLSGCATPARVIRQDAASVVVAVPDNTNAWPFYYQDEARQLASGYVKDPVLVASQRVKVGEQVTNSTDTTRRDIGGQKPVGDVVTSSSTTSVSDRYEYHLEYRSSSPLRGPVTFSTGPAGPAASLNPQGPQTGDPNKPLTDPLQPLKPPATPATNLPPTTLPGPGR